MELKEAIRKRESVGGFLDKPISEAQLNNVLEAARLAPSASNRQPTKLVVIQDSAKRKELAQAANNQASIGEAPTVIAAVAIDLEFTMPCGIKSDAREVAIAIDHMTLAAVDEGLGTCWIGAFSQEKVKEILKVPDQYKVIILLSLGHPRKERGHKPRKPLNEIVCYDSFRE
jgi:nitroreductase